MNGPIPMSFNRHQCINNKIGETVTENSCLDSPYNIVSNSPIPMNFNPNQYRQSHGMTSIVPNVLPNNKSMVSTNVANNNAHIDIIKREIEPIDITKNGYSKQFEDLYNELLLACEIILEHAYITPATIHDVVDEIKEKLKMILHKYDYMVNIAFGNYMFNIINNLIHSPEFYEECNSHNIINKESDIMISAKADFSGKFFTKAHPCFVYMVVKEYIEDKLSTIYNIGANNTQKYLNSLNDA